MQACGLFKSACLSRNCQIHILVIFFACRNKSKQAGIDSMLKNTQVMQLRQRMSVGVLVLVCIVCHTVLSRADTSVLRKTCYYRYGSSVSCAVASPSVYFSPDSQHFSPTCMLVMLALPDRGSLPHVREHPLDVLAEHQTHKAACHRIKCH